MLLAARHQGRLPADVSRALTGRILKRVESERRQRGGGGMVTYRNGHLNVDGASLQSLVDRLGSPIFLVSEACLRRNYEALTQGLAAAGTKVIVRYCAKANNEAGVLAILAACGSDIVVSHLAEAQLALRCGFAADRIAYQQPVLLEPDLRVVMRAGVTFFHAFRLQDLDLIDRVATDLGKPVRVSLRLRHDSLRARVSALNFLSLRLGVPSTDVPRAVEAVRNSRRLSLAGVNFYVGTQRRSIGAYRALIRRTMRLASRLQSAYGVAFDEINVGGGIPSPSLRAPLQRAPIRTGNRLTEPEPAAAVRQFAHALAVEYCGAAQRAGVHPVPALAVEPGRSIVGNAVILVSRVHAVKGRWVFVDASRNYLGESFALLSRRILPASQPAVGGTRRYHLSGSTLSALDVLGLWRRLAPLAAGDLLAFCDAGAYSLSQAARRAGVLPAAYVLYSTGEVRMMRRPETLSDLTASMVLPGDDVTPDD